MLMPKRTKFRKAQRGRMTGKATTGGRRQLWRVRPESARTLLVDQPADRGGSCGADSSPQARRKDLDSGVPG